MESVDDQAPRIPNYHQPRSHYRYLHQIDRHYYPVFNNLQQQSETMMFHPRQHRGQSIYNPHPVDGFGSPFRVNNRRPINHVGNGRHGPYIESNGRGTRTVLLGFNVSFEDEIAILDNVRGEFVNFNMRLSTAEEGTLILNESDLTDRESKRDQDKGLLEEKIWQHLNTRFFQIPCSISDQDSRFCVVCQSEFENGEKLGRLECGHEYHAVCIHRWLLERNVCPVCKSRAIAQVENF